MHIRVIAMGTRMPAWVQAGVAEYQKRFPREWAFKWVELPLSPRTKAATGAKARARGVAGSTAMKATEAEGQAILAAINPRETVIALDVAGNSWSTERLAKEMNAWQLEGDNLCLLIGGPEGLSRACLQRADRRWSLSALTLPHPLVRIILAEQLYRSWSLLNHHPYHK